MSTRSVFTFKDENRTFHIYKHCDGYPAGAADAINEAIKFAWELPRFEARDFSAAFVAANKEGSGNVYLTTHYDDHHDLDYRYVIYFDNKDNELSIKAYSRSWKDTDFDNIKYELIFHGNLNNFINEVERLEQNEEESDE